jgi:hypothetical protein
MELKEDDKKIYDKLMSDSLTLKELIEYRNEVMKEGNNSQKIFSAYIGTKLTSKLGRKELNQKTA